jgi:hypothetical protein
MIWEIIDTKTWAQLSGINLIALPDHCAHLQDPCRLSSVGVFYFKGGGICQNSEFYMIMI